MKGVSIIICCYNSSSRIKPTLEHIAQLIVPDTILWEVIIVDNNSNDDTKDKCIDLWDMYGKTFIPFSIVSEYQQGLSHARKKGFLASKYDYLLYCDDDNWLEDDYLTKVFEIMESDANIGVLGGKGEAVSDGALPEWFHDVQAYYAVGAQKSNNSPLYGAGITLKKDGLSKLYDSGFDFLLDGRKGKKLSSGEDTEIQLLFKIMGYKITYSNQLKFKHFIPTERLSKEYFNHLVKGAAASLPILTAYQHHLDNKVNNRILFFVFILKTIIWIPLIMIKYIFSSQLEKNHIIQRLIFSKKIISQPNIYLKARKKIKSIQSNLSEV